VLRECAAVPVASLEEMLDVLLQLSGQELAKLPQGRGVATVTFGGGMGVLSADQCDRAGLAVPPLADATRHALDGLAPPIASLLNPVDFTPAAYSDPKWLEVFPQALDAISADPQVGSIVFTLGPMARDEDVLARIVTEFRARCPKPVLVAWPLATETALVPLRDASVHVFPEASRAIRTLGRLAAYAEALTAPPSASITPSFDWNTALPDAKPGMVVAEHACHAILERAGLKVAPGTLARSEAEAVDALRRLGPRVVMKGISPTVTHRAAAGLVALDIASADQASETWRGFQERAGVLGATLDGIYIQQQIAGGLELLVAALRDPMFGIFVLLGAGGVLTETIDDVVVVPAPLDEAAARDALRRLRVLRKHAGDVAAMQPLTEFVVCFSQLAATAPWRRFTLELNPVKWTGDAAIAVDGLLLVEQP
jgi:acetate---CoA ligase (ADP-forming)